MFNSRLLRLKNFVLVVPVLILAASMYAFAAANTVPTSKAGDGAGAVSGYTVSNITYFTEDGDSDPATLDRIDFDLDAAANTTKVKPDQSSSTWFGCTNPSGTSWSCTITSTNTADVDEIRVVATE